MKTSQDKIKQACNLLNRQRLRTRSLANTVRDMAMLLSENSQMIDERNQMVAHPLGFVHGNMGQLRELIGADVSLRFDCIGDALMCTVTTPNGSQPFSFSPTDYEMNLDMLASSIRGICEQRGLIAKAKED